MPITTITTTLDHAQRIAAAYGDKLNLPGAATEAQIKAALIDEIKSVVRGYEAKLAHSTVTLSPDVEPT